MLNRSARGVRVVKLGLVLMFVIIAGFVSGCVRASEGTLWLREAPLAQGWPALTPVGEVQVKDYPATRAAVVRDESVGPGGQNMNTMFGELFDHIKANDIAMTTPVEMGYEDGGTSGMASMAFLYRRPDQGTAGAEGPVTVEDLPGRTYASLGVRGNYTDERFADRLAVLDAWLTEHADQWLPDGPPRYLGYNSPFVPGFMRYGEVQRPVRPAGE